MSVRVRCDVSDALEASRRLLAWVESAEAGDQDGDEMAAELGRIGDLVDGQRVSLLRAMGR